MPRLALYALTVCLLAVAAAVVSFVNGSWLGVVWILLAGLTSNMWWYYRRKARLDAAASASATGAPASATGAPASAEAASTADPAR